MATRRTILSSQRIFFTTNSTLPQATRQSVLRQLKHKQQCRNYANGWPSGPRRGGYQYQRFSQTSAGLLKRWAARPTFYYEVGGLAGACGGFYIYNLEEVPVSGRRRFNVISANYEQQSGQELYRQVMNEYSGRILPPSHPQHRMVQRVLNRLIPHASVSSNTNWEVHVIHSDEKNAFVIPGGKVFVFSGILDVCQGEPGLAAVLGHEIAHNVAHHSAERMSSYAVFLPVAIVASLLLGLGDIGNVFTRAVVDLAFLRPGSRKQESEADYIGLMMMAQACYDPTAAVGLWARMHAAEQGAPPEFISTHPSSHNRMEKIQSWLGKAEMEREKSGCGQVSDYADQFRDTFSFRWS